MLVIARSLGINLNRKQNFAKCFELASSLSTSAGNESTNEERAKKLSEYLGCTSIAARRFIQLNKKIASIETDELNNTLAFCKINLKVTDVFEFPMILTLPYNVLNHRYQTLKELGFRRVGARLIMEFSKIMSETPSTLQKKGIPLQLDPPTNILNCECFTEAQKSELKSKLLEMYSKDSKLSVIKTKLTTEFLLSELKCPKEKLNKIIKNNPMILLYSIEEIEATLNILKEKFGFTAIAIYNLPFLLSFSSSQLQNFFDTVPEILGISIQTVVRKQPAILRRPPSSIKKMEEILKEFHISSCQLMCNLNIFKLSPFLLKHRLEILLKSEDFALLKKDKNFLSLVYHFKNLHQRIKLLKTSDVPYSISMLVAPEHVFRSRLKHRLCTHYAKDIVCHLSKMYDCDAKIVRERIQEYPKIGKASVVNAYKVIDFLMCREVTKQQLWNGLGILAYELHVVEEYYNKMKQYKEFQPFEEWKGHFNFIQLLIYAIDRMNYCTIAQTELSLDSQEQSEVSQTKYYNDDDESSIERLADYKIDIYSGDEEESEISDAYIL